MQQLLHSEPAHPDEQRLSVDYMEEDRGWTVQKNQRPSQRLASRTPQENENATKPDSVGSEEDTVEQEHNPECNRWAQVAQSMEEGGEEREKGEVRLVLILVEPVVEAVELEG